MDEDLAIINTNTRNEKIKNFLIKFKNIIFSIIFLIVIIVMIFFGYGEYTKSKKESISNLYNSTIIDYSESTKKETTDTLIEIIDKRDTTYSPLSLYFILDNNLISEKARVNELFNIIIEKTKLENEIKNLVIYKKALYNADLSNENELIGILKPILNSESIWKSHALYLIAEYFFSKGEKNKSKEFFSQILLLENSNQDIIREAQKRLNRDLSE
jgi:hypothetical protein